MNIKSNFGKALKRIREAKGLTQEDFVGIMSRTHMSVLETGKKGPNLETMSLIADRLEISLTSLVFFTESNNFDGDFTTLTKYLNSEIDTLQKLLREN